MSAIELIGVITSSGVLLQGIAALKWAVGVEVRLKALESRSVGKRTTDAG
jgi:hypothetical protein